MISKNGVGLVVLALSVFGLEVAESEVFNVISAIGTIISFTLMVINQLQRREVVGFLFKK